MLIDLVAPLGWVTIILLGLGLFYDEYKRELNSSGLLFLSIILIIMTPFFWVQEDSIVEAILTLLGAFVCIYVAKLVLQSRISIQKTIVMVLSASIVLLVSYSLASFQSYLITTVAGETSTVLNLIGFETAVLSQQSGTFIIFENTGGLKTEIVLACTGIGSIAIFMGLSLSLSSFSVPRRIVIALFTSGVIYVLNIFRNVFIAAAYGGQLLHIAPNAVEGLFGREGSWVSYYIADKIIAQTGSAIFLALFALFIVTKIEEESSLFDEWVNIIDNLKKDLENTD